MNGNLMGFVRYYRNNNLFYQVGGSVKALVLKKYGSPQNLNIMEVNKPVVTKDEVLVKVKAVSINDWDLGIISGRPFVNRLVAGLFRPKMQILGSDIAGVIEAVGDTVSNFQVGDKVYGDLSGDKFGGFAEYVVTSEKHLWRMAEKMPFDIAAAIPQAGMLAYQALYDFIEITEGMSILINGAGGGVGTFAAQMFKKHHVHLTGVDADVKREMLLKLGYDEFISYQQTDFTELNQQYDMIIDCKTNRSLYKYSKVLKENGMYVTIGGDMLKVIRIMLMPQQLEKKLRRKYRCVQLHTNLNLSEINKMFEEGRLTAIIDPQRFTLETGREAMTYYASGKQLGKVVIVVDA